MHKRFVSSSRYCIRCFHSSSFSFPLFPSHVAEELYYSNPFTGSQPPPRRLSRALLHFKALCARRKRRRQLKLALRITNDLSQRRPMQRRWSSWQAIVREARVRAAFFAWAKAGRRKRRIRIAARVMRASKETTAVVGVWNTWRRMAGASKLARLLGAWGVIGPVRRSLYLMQTNAKEARAEQWRRVQLLRCEF